MGQKKNDGELKCSQKGGRLPAKDFVSGRPVEEGMDLHRGRTVRVAVQHVVAGGEHQGGQLPHGSLPADQQSRGKCATYTKKIATSKRYSVKKPNRIKKLFILKKYYI